MEENNPLKYSNEETIERIIKLTDGLAKFWSSSYGWAPIETAKLLSKSRLDWQVSLARMLRFFNNKDIEYEEGALILAWTTLGSLTEGILKLFLSVWYSDYKNSLLKSSLKGYTDEKGKLKDPDILQLEKLKVFFAKEVYDINDRKRWKEQGQIDIIDWISKIQQRRNAIHAFKNREIGDFQEFFSELKNFLRIMRFLTDDFPYPDGFYGPKET